MTAERWRRIKEVFQSAVEQSPENRDAYLASVTNDDSGLRREVDKMLRHSTGAGLLDTPAWDSLGFERELEAGTQLGPYEILEQVGAGGMGRVYKARDTRLGRMVAIKVLSAEFSHRLWIEGRVISSLNHPHVCALFDIGDQDGTAYLVMEYIEGESLAARLRRGPLPLDEVLRYGGEIASALVAAHAQGVVHRDLKPANIMITASGAKVLDFGVARMMREEETAAGEVSGTAAYMSPSQLNGNPADVRSDIYALGLVLYEMAAGTRYSSEAADPLSRMPGGLANLVERCLRRDSSVRVQRMEEVRIELDRLHAASDRSALRRRTRWAWLAVPVAIAAAAVIMHRLDQGPAQSRTATVPARVSKPVSETAGAPARQSVAEAPPQSPAVTHARIAPLGTAPLQSQPLTTARTRPSIQPAPPLLISMVKHAGYERDPSFSPDGSMIAFAGQPRGSGGYSIFVTPVKSTLPPIQLTSGVYEDWGPAWSPDGTRIAFRRKNDGIFWVPATGGPETLVAPIGRLGQETLPQVSWSRDGKWIATPDRGEGGATQIYLLNVASGEKRQISDNSSGTAHAPAFSPDGKSLAYGACAGAVYPCDVVMVSLGSGLSPKKYSRITQEASYIRGLAWLPNGRELVYSAGMTVGTDTFLWKVPADGRAIPQRIEMAGTQARHPAISPTGGNLAYTRLSGWTLMLIENFY